VIEIGVAAPKGARIQITFCEGPMRGVAPGEQIPCLERNKVAVELELSVIRVNVRVDCSNTFSKSASASRTWQVSELAAASPSKGFIPAGRQRHRRKS
jgi:hypothetical protein